MKKLVTANIVQFILLILLFLIIILQFLGISLSKTSIVQNCQPENLEYDNSGISYCVWIYRVNNILDKEYKIWITNDEHGYGYYAAYPEQHIVNEENLQNLDIQWDEDGVRINRYGTDTFLFVPKEDFIGER